MANELDGGGHNVIVRNRKEGGLGVHRNVPYEFASRYLVRMYYILYTIYCSRYVFCVARRNSIMSERNPSPYCTLALIAMQGHTKQNKDKEHDEQAKQRQRTR